MRPAPADAPDDFHRITGRRRVVAPGSGLVLWSRGLNGAVQSLAGRFVLRGVILIIMHPLGATKERNFRKLMGEAGDLAIPKHMHPYPRMQMLTVEQILAGETFHTPGARGRGDRQFDWIGASSASNP